MIGSFSLGRADRAHIGTGHVITGGGGCPECIDYIASHMSWLGAF
jgi:hypothetical protein